MHTTVTGLCGCSKAFTPFTITDIVSTWLALAWLRETSYPDTVEGRLEFEKEQQVAIEKWPVGMDNLSSLMVYSVLESDEQEYVRALKVDVVHARPDLAVCCQSGMMKGLGCRGW